MEQEKQDRRQRHGAVSILIAGDKKRMTGWSSLFFVNCLQLECESDSDEIVSLECCATDETAVDVWLCEELLGV